MWVSGTPPLGTQRSEHQASEARRSAKRNPSHQPSASLAFDRYRGALVGRAIPEIEAPQESDLSAEEEPTPLPSRRRRRTGEAIPLANLREFLPSTHFVNKGKRKSRGCYEPRPGVLVISQPSLWTIACIWS
jgi:hypothetical protein